MGRLGHTGASLAFKRTVFEGGFGAQVMQCKRIHVRNRSGSRHLAAEYVTEGMQRFVDGEYSKGVPCGGMIGYVMDNDLDAAFRRVRSEIKTRRRALRVSTRHADKAPSAALPAWQHSTDTWHRRSDGEFLLHHALLGVA